MGGPRPAARLCSGVAAPGADRERRSIQPLEAARRHSCLLTTNAQLAALPGNVTVPTEAADLEADSVVNVTQIATIDRATLEARAGALPDWLMAQVDAGLARALALARP